MSKIPGLADTNPQDGVSRSHPRSGHVVRAGKEIDGTLRDLWEKHDLTPSELLEILAYFIGGVTGSCVEKEREEATEEYRKGKKP